MKPRKSSFACNARYTGALHYTHCTLQKTTRNPLEALFNTNTSDGHSILYQLTLDALEEEDFCNFESALEFLHNRVHFFIGGSGTYSMSTLDYSAFDPVFIIVHSGMDRIWALWQVIKMLTILHLLDVQICFMFNFVHPNHH